MGGRLKNTYIGSQSQIASGVGGTWGIVGSTTLTSPASAITFSGISASYTSYQILLFIKDNHNAGGIDFGIRFNGDTGNNYYGIVTFANGAIVTSVDSGAADNINIGSVSEAERSYNFMQISNSIATDMKTMFNIGGQVVGAAGNEQYWTNGLWANQTNSITSFTLLATANMHEGTKVIVLGSS